MNFSENPSLRTLFDALFTPYKIRVPAVLEITKAMMKAGIINSQSDIENDHIAFRTLGVPHLGISSIEKIFMHYGFKKKDAYLFEKKKLNAFWYAPPHPSYPRIFISELRVNDLSEKAQNIIKKYTSSIDKDPVDALNLEDATAVGTFFQKPLWNIPSLEDYEFLNQESEYAAWVIYNRYYLNHYTISVHELPSPYNELEEFNQFLVNRNITLNNAGGVIKKSADGLLKQSSSVAEMVEAKFACGNKKMIPGSYVEFTERLVLPKFSNIPKHQLTREHRRDGFEAGNADKIFESTFKSQTSQ